MENPKNNGDENVDHFLLNLYKEVSVEQRWQSDEISDLKSSTKEMVKRIVNEAVSPYMEEYKLDGLTQVIVSEAGSMADGTSIIDPDEFDFTMAFVYSSNTIDARLSSNLRDISLSKFTVKPEDPRFKEIYLNNEKVLPYQFVQHNFHRLEDAISKLRDSGPVQRGDKSLYLCSSDGQGTYYGMQGPSFHLHNLLKWHSPNRQTDLSISIDLVPAIQLNDKAIAENIPLFKQECQCGEHKLSKPEQCLLMPMKCREIVYSSILHYDGEGDNNHWKDKRDFLKSNFLISFSKYENDLLKEWKCEKSMYHNWYICYALMKCFGKLDHDCSSTVTYNAENTEIKFHKSLTFPERNESFSSYSWKNMVFTKAKKECGQSLSLSQCFNSLTSVFEDENLKISDLIRIELFWCPSEIAENVHIRRQDSVEYTPFVESMKSVKSTLYDVKTDADYNYEKYKKRLVKLFPELSLHLFPVVI